MKNPPAPYKHADKSYSKYSKTGDGSLLAKRQNFAAGGAAYPIQGASGSARWQGAGPDSYAAMRSEMSPSDFATFRSKVSPAEYDTFMGNTPAQPAATSAPGAAATPALSLPPAPEFKPQTFTQSVARPAVPAQAEQKVQPYVKSGPVA